MRVLQSVALLVTVIVYQCIFFMQRKQIRELRSVVAKSLAVANSCVGGQTRISLPVTPPPSSR